MDNFVIIIIVITIIVIILPLLLVAWSAMRWKASKKQLTAAKVPLKQQTQNIKQIITLNFK